MQVFNKLVRDKIPEIIAKNGAVASTRIIESDDEYIKELSKKLVEEAKEFQEAPSLEELADTKEVLDALIIAMGHTTIDLQQVQTEKAEKRGKFEKKIYLISTEG